MKRSNLTWLFPFLALSLWCMFCLTDILHVRTSAQISEIAATTEILVHVVIIYCGFKIYHTLQLYDKKIFSWFLYASIALFLNDFSFYMIIYIYKIPISSVSFVAFLSYYIPFLLWLVAATTFLSKMLLSQILKSKPSIKMLSAFFVFNFVVIAFFFLSMQEGLSAFSPETISQTITSIYKLFFFDLTMLCLICVEEWGMLLLLSGIAVLTSSDFLFNYSSVAQVNNVLVYGELFWLLGMLLMLMGVICIERNKSFEIKSCFRSTSAIKSRLVFWTFGVSIASFLLFFMFAYSFSLITAQIFAEMPFFILLYSVIVVILSNFMGRYFEAPFKKLAGNIEIFMKNKNKDGVESNFTIDEFDFLQKFILTTFEVNEEKDIAKKELGIVASQVAHDIRSPVAAILMLAKECIELPEEQRISLRDAANRIQDIANNLLHHSQTKIVNEFATNITKFLVSTALLSVISEKKVQYKNSKISIHYDIQLDAMFAFIYARLSEFKRVISNLLNNAIDAIKGAGNIVVKVTIDAHLIKIDIIDSGQGMLPEIRDKILSGQVISNKAEGLGLGFSHARAFLAVSEGKLEIATSENKGLTVSLIFKKAMAPTWIANQIGFYDNGIVVILDDDSSIHGAWDSLFAPTFAEYPNLEVVHFTQAIKCIAYLKGLQPEIRARILLLTDYELIKQDFNGLDVVELVQLNQAILVTSHYENHDILKRAALLNTKVLPKLLAPSIKLQSMRESVPAKKAVDLVILEDNKEFSGVLAYLCQFRGKSADIYHESYTLFESLNQYDKLTTKICLDFDLDSSVNGVEVAIALYQRGFKQLFLATGHQSISIDVPPYLCVLADKMELLEL